MSSEGEIPKSHTRKPDPSAPWRYVCPDCESQVFGYETGRKYRCNKCGECFERRELKDLKGRPGEKPEVPSELRKNLELAKSVRKYPSKVGADECAVMREKEADGEDLREIAEESRWSYRTVRKHVRGWCGCQTESKKS